MESLPVIAVFDIGKTNKKLFLFDEAYKIVYEKSETFRELFDEDGFPCEDLEKLQQFLFDSLKEVLGNKLYRIKAIQLSAYGASLVILDKNGKPLTPLYNYLKPYPQSLRKEFYQKYGGEEVFSLETASPVLGNLNSGLQLYRFKKEKPNLFDKVYYALHLPQYMSFLLTGIPCSDITSIGCHTALWDFNKNTYHNWVIKEGILDKLAPLISSEKVFPSNSFIPSIPVGIGLHDSSAALIPYLTRFKEAFVLISTGTWCISLNPFNSNPLTPLELKNDCLSYLQYQGNPVKASRIFLGNEHEIQVKRIASFFNTDPKKYQNLEFNQEISFFDSASSSRNPGPYRLLESEFSSRELSGYKNDIEAYYRLVQDLVNLQFYSTNLIIGDKTLNQICIDGGFANNTVYMNLLARLYPDKHIYASFQAQSTALGAALSLHSIWNTQSLPVEPSPLIPYSDMD